MIDDPLYQNAKKIARENGFVNVSAVQRWLRIGYTNAAWIVEQMVAEGFCAADCDEHGRKRLIEADTLRLALAESLKLQSHYANLLNEYDGGKRMTFEEPGQWLIRLKTTQV